MSKQDDFKEFKRNFDSSDIGERLVGIPEDTEEFIDFMRHNEEVYRIYHYIQKKGATYPSEIATDLFYEVKRVSRILSQLEQAGHTKRLFPNDCLNDTRLLNRRREMYSRGIKGLELWRRMHWVGLTSVKAIYKASGHTPISQEELTNELKEITEARSNDRTG